MGDAGGISFTIYKGSQNGKIVEGTTKRDALVGEEVLLRVTHSSLCATDEVYLQADMCLGHECAGVVEQLGPEAKGFKIGDNVGFGFQHSCCDNCHACINGQENYCPAKIGYATGDLDTGSMASNAIFRSSFLYHIPEGMSNETGAALMCGGATVFNLFETYNIKPTDRVGVVGIGGLGHLAIQIGAKWGCEVVAFSGTESKKEEAMKLGATEFYSTKGKDTLDEVREPVDHLIVTTGLQVPWGMYIPVVRAPGTIYPLMVDFTNLVVPFVPFLLSGLRFQASIIAPRAVHKKMLAFCARTGIKPIVMRYRLGVEGIEKALEDLKGGKMRYRGVLWTEDWK
ncbi:hypothetical protein MMC25_006769 [Agyrium rufum]|nr:hypothetical protein [Agyrium rufum]